MAADSVNKMTTDCAGCSAGDLSSVPGFEGKKVPVTEIREVTQNRGTNVHPATNRMSSAAAAPATQLHQIGTVSLSVADPRTENSATAQGKQSATLQAATDGAGSSGDLPDAITANLSSEGFVFTSESEVHLYETTLTSDDFLSLNSSQKDTLAAAGFISASTDTIRSYRDVTYYTFANQTTGSEIYVMAIQQLDADGNAIGDRHYSVSPEFPLQSGASHAGTARTAAASTIDRNGSCFWNWVSVSLLIVVLIIDLAVLISSGTLADGDTFYFGEYRVIMDMEYDLGINIYRHGKTGSGLIRVKDYEIDRDVFYAAGILTGLVILILLAYEIYKLGVCMKWWDEISWDSVAWTYQERAGYAENGKTLPVALHDRIAIALPANTSADKNAAWVPDLTGAGGLVIKDTKNETLGNSTIQTWLFEADKEGPQQLTVRYTTTAPIPPDIPTTTFTLLLPVLPGNWKIAFVDNSSSRYGTGLYTSLAFDPAGTPHISSYDAGNGRIRYSSWNGTGWESGTVANSAGTYSTSLAFDKTGNPAISFGDGYHFGNLMFATKNGMNWETDTVAWGLAGDAGQDSSLAFDKNGVPHITYNDGQSYATLKYATRSGTNWETFEIDIGGFLGDTGYGSSLKFDDGGFPHVAYTNGKSYASLRYAENTGTGWDVTTVNNGGGLLESTGFTPSLAFDSKGFPHVSYYDASKKDHMYSSWWNGIGWVTETVDHVNDVGEFSSLAIDANNNPHISYYDASNHELRYATKIGDTWIKRTIDNDGKVGQFSSLALDPAGHPCIAYFDDTHHALKYAGWAA
ncbi:hypothetical protein [Methanoregula boonei]|nr:hypothetical protein [Methanoregula boonei]